MENRLLKLKANYTSIGIDSEDFDVGPRHQRCPSPLLTKFNSFGTTRNRDGKYIYIENSMHSENLPESLHMSGYSEFLLLDGDLISDQSILN